MDEPPAKRPRRDERNRDGDRDVGNTASPRSPRAHDERRHDSRTNGYDSRRRDNDRRRKRSRSRSPVRDRHAGNRRDRSRDRDRPYRDRDRDAGRMRDRDERDFKQRKQSRSRSPHRNGESARTRSPGRGPGPPRNDGGRNVKKEVKTEVHVKKSDSSEAMDLMPVEGEDEEAVVKRIMGFGTFRTTKNTKVPGNQIYGVRKEKKTTYRQYMNRVGGFNRPLSPTRT